MNIRYINNNRNSNRLICSYLTTITIERETLASYRFLTDRHCLTLSTWNSEKTDTS